MYSQELAGVAKSAFAASLFSANIYYFLTSNYFAATAAEIPLLHLWSLGVEEQFYIFFPLLAILLAKANKRVFVGTLIALLDVLIVLSEWALNHSPSSAFYLLPFRAFELLIGCAIAFPQRAYPQTPIINNVLLGLAFLVLFFCICCYTSDMSFPGFNALLPCLATAILLLVGSGKSALSIRLLENEPARYIGKLSYSLYLLNWPVIVFGKRLFPNATAFHFNVSVLVATFILAAICYRLVETPFRATKRSSSPLRIYGNSLASLCCIMAISGLTIYKNGFTESPDERVAKAMSYLQYDPKPAFRTGECFF
ncbi:acyltransferase family protein [Pseudomonas sp. NPDC090203]|uniref:acyltransferase family protein n=1 Tax=Pseudomonas sp. NPDC090203 TaxID=3364477 RepID=UPI003800F792